MRISNFIPVVLAFIGAALLASIAAAITADRIEKSTHAQVTRILLADGQDWTDVSVDGLQVFLSGTAPDEATRFRAVRLAAQIVDGARVIDTMGVQASAGIKAPRFSIEILRNDSGISLIGLVPDAMDREAVARTITGLADGANVTDLLESADYPVPSGWVQAISFALDALEQLPRSKISVAADRVEIKAISNSEAERKRLEDRLIQDVPKGVELILDIFAPRPVITPFTLRFTLDENGGHFDACSAHTNNGRALILAAAAKAGLQGAVTCRLGLGVPSPTWPDAVSAGLAALAELGGGSITFSDADVSLVALDSIEQEHFDRVVGDLKASLPEVFSLAAVKPAPPEANGTPVDAGPPEFIATLSPEGLLQLRGRVVDERQRSAVEGFALVRFGGSQVRTSMREDDTLPDGWAARVFAGIEALSMLKNGSLVVSPDTVEIRGKTGDVNASSEIARILSDQLGGTESFAIAVEYVEALDPTSDLPTPQVCVDRLNAVLAEKKVTFAPGSAQIESDGFNTIDGLVRAIDRCDTVAMEIGGHTDSQGREEMNQQLSKQRADAILEALQSRRVLTGNLTTKGYGEEVPIADNGTEEGREANRRIEFTLVEPDQEGEEGDDVVTDDAAQETPESETAVKPNE